MLFELPKLHLIFIDLIILNSNLINTFFFYNFVSCMYNSIIFERLNITISALDLIIECIAKNFVPFHEF